MPLGRAGFLLNPGMRSLNAQISALFANGEAGAVYDPSDLSTMRAVATGAPQAAVGDPVCTLLDKRLGLARGPELLTNGDFSAWSGDNPTGWNMDFTENGTNFVAQVAGGARIVCDNATAVTQISQAGILTAGNVYEVSVVQTAQVAGGVIIGRNANAPDSITNPGVGSLTQFIVATGSGAFVLRRQGVTDITIQSVSCKQVLGNHATQATSTKRPILRQTAGGLYYLEHDGVDDCLVSAFMIAQPIVRISGVSLRAWVANKRLFAEASGAAAGRLYTDPAGSPTIGIYSGASITTTDLTVGSAGVVTERHNGGSGRLAVNSLAYVTGNSSTLLPAGISIGAKADGSEAAQLDFYGTVMIGRDLTDAEVATARRYQGLRCGVAL